LASEDDSPVTEPNDAASDARLQLVVDSIERCPAWIANPRFDIVFWNWPTPMLLGSTLTSSALSVDSMRAAIADRLDWILFVLTPNDRTTADAFERLSRAS
jgi:hypothetical protein